MNRHPDGNRHETLLYVANMATPIFGSWQTNQRHKMYSEIRCAPLIHGSKRKTVAKFVFFVFRGRQFYRATRMVVQFV